MSVSKISRGLIIKRKRVVVKVVPAGLVQRINKVFTRPIARYVSKWRYVTPARITYLSAIVGGLLPIWPILTGHTVLAAAFVLIGSWLDSLDGDIAREQGQSTPEGTILDAVLDRYVDFIVISAIILSSPTNFLLPGLAALLGSMIVPYVRSKAEAEGKSSAVTIGSRDIRNIILVVGLMSGRMLELLIVLAVVSNISAVHRFIVACRKSSR